MKLYLGFEELSDFIRKEYSQNIGFSYVSENELKVSYSRKILFKTIQVPVELKIVEARGSKVGVEYGSRFGIDMILGGVLAFIREQFSELNSWLQIDGKKITVDFLNQEKTKQIFEKLSLRDIAVKGEGIEIEATLIG